MLMPCARILRDDRKGFTLAELLIVVAIVLVLVAIAVPVFAGTLDNANKAVAAANDRSARSEAMVDYMLNNREGNWQYAWAVNKQDGPLGDAGEIIWTTGKPGTKGESIGSSIGYAYGPEPTDYGYSGAFVISEDGFVS